MFFNEITYQGNDPIILDIHNTSGNISLTKENMKKTPSPITNNIKILSYTQANNLCLVFLQSSKTSYNM
jgi:hypothetical protein